MKLKVIKLPLKECSPSGLPYVPDRALEYQLNYYGDAVVKVIPVQEAVSSNLSVTTFVLLIDADKAPTRIATDIKPTRTRKPLNESEVLNNGQ